MRESCVDVILDEALDSFFLESNRTVSLQPLIESAHSRSPLPAVARLRLQYKFLADGFRVLLLHDGINVGFGEILIQIHLVVQILETCHTAQDKVVCLMLQIQTSVQQVTLVTTGTVVRYFSDIVAAIFRLAVGTSGVFIRITSLIGIFIIHRQVQFQVVCRQVDSAETTSEFIVRIDALVVEAVLEEASLVLVEEACRESKLRRKYDDNG